jgi:hypothetical protein
MHKENAASARVDLSTGNNYLPAETRNIVNQNVVFSPIFTGYRVQ